MGTDANTATRHLTIRCQFCETWNRIDASRAADRPKCGKCAKPMLLDRPIHLDDDTFARTIARQRRSGARGLLRRLVRAVQNDGAVRRRDRAREAGRGACREARHGSRAAHGGRLRHPRHSDERSCSRTARKSRGRSVRFKNAGSRTCSRRRCESRSFAALRMTKHNGARGHSPGPSSSTAVSLFRLRACLAPRDSACSTRCPATW